MTSGMTAQTLLAEAPTLQSPPSNEADVGGDVGGQVQALEQALALDAASFDLWGSRLIEASAGTGKTYTIAALYVRLVLGHGNGQNHHHGFERALKPAEILVMTFTRAATRELCDRIRERLLHAAQWFRGEQSADAIDPFLQTLLGDYPTAQERSNAAWRLSLAAQSMDDAAVHTIDAWCQRMLKEHAFDSGCLFDETLVADEELLRLQAVQDYWRRFCYPLDPTQLATVLEVWPDIHALAKDMKNLSALQLTPEEDAGSLAQTLARVGAQRQQALAQIKATWQPRCTEMQDWLDAQTAGKNQGWNGQRLASKNYTKWLDTLKAWAHDPGADDTPALKTGWERLTPAGLQDARKDGAPLPDLPPVFGEFAGLRASIEALPSVAQALRHHAACQVAQRLLQLKRHSSSFGFADMLQRLHSALRGPNGERLRQRILAQYPVALIDEFQDTSPLQYQIFDLIYRTASNDPHQALLLIGDPKQSIYGFRGADIYSYLQARQATAGRHYVLQTNYRSTHALVDAVNHWFAQADAAQPEGAFMFRQGQDNPLPFVAVQAHGRKEVLRSGSGPVPALSIVHALQHLTTPAARALIAAQCAEHIVGLLSDPAAGFAEDEKPLRRLRPADMAVLVRTGSEADTVRQALARRGVASVYLSDKDSVFNSPVARDLLHWLRAVASPQDVRLVRAGLATRTMGLSLEELARLATDDLALDAHLLQLRALHQTWQTQGVLAMLRHTLHRWNLPSAWLQSLDGERTLTNYLHLAELLQAASTAIDSEQALIRWLEAEIADGAAQADEKIVRLESDADLVQVVTIHKSKGLEYPMVFLPFATDFREQGRKNTSYVQRPQSDGTRTLQLHVTDDDLALAERERLREDLRLLYVALTRARHALWIGFAALKKGNSDQCSVHKSATGYLLGGPDAAHWTEGAQWWHALQALQRALPDTLVLQASRESLEAVPCTMLAPTSAAAPLRDAPIYAAEFDRLWRIGSFSQLTRDLGQEGNGRGLSTLQTLQPADDEPDVSHLSARSDEADLDDAVEGQDRAANAVRPRGEVVANGLGTNGLAGDVIVPSGAAVWHQFPRGAEAGNFLHDQLEWLATEGFALPGNPAVSERLLRRCERAGRASHGGAVVEWLSQVVQTPLPGPGICLQHVHNRLPEMEFWLRAERLDTQALDQLCHQHLLPGIARAPLAQRTLHGMLMGFADLVFEHDGRFWVLDYKSNHLGTTDADYTTAAMAQEMARHRYDVQAAIYLLALHRLLRSRLGDAYQPEHQLGGAVYLFLRGIGGPQNGVYLLPAALDVLQPLDAMLGHEESLP